MVEFNRESVAVRRGGELVSVQYLRAAASLAVVGWHAAGQVGVSAWPVLQAGIEVFFLISGFVIWTVVAEHPTMPGRFLARRLARIAPFYWAITSVTVLLLAARPDWFQSLRFEPVHTALSYLFVPWPNPTPGVGLRPLVIPGWTLNYEVLFYLAVAAVLYLPSRWRGVCLAAALVGLPFLRPWIGHASPPLDFYTSPLTAELGLGVLLALLLARWSPPAWAAWGLLGGGGLLLAMGASVWDGGSLPRLLLLCAPTAMLLTGFIALDLAGKVASWRLLKSVGDASFALYLIHPLMLSAMVQAWRRLGGSSAPGIVFVGLAVITTTLAGLVVHRLIEKPMTHAVQNWLGLSRAKAASSPKAAIA